MKFIIAKIKAEQILELLDIYEEVINHPNIEIYIKHKIENNFRLVRLPILSEMDDYFS